MRADLAALREPIGEDAKDGIGGRRVVLRSHVHVCLPRAREHGGLPIDRFVLLVQSDEPRISKQHAWSHSAGDGRETMIGCHDERRLGPEARLVDQLQEQADLPVGLLDRADRLRAPQTVGVLFLVDVDQVHHHEVRLAALEDVGGDFGDGVVLGVGKEPRPEIGMRARHVVEQARRRERAGELPIVVVAGPPIFGEEPRRMGAHRHGPTHERRTVPGAPRELPHGRDLQVLGVPAPPTEVLFERIERAVRRDAVPARMDARRHRRVRGVRDGREHRPRPGAERAMAREESKRGNAQPVGVGPEVRLRNQPVDGHEKDVPNGPCRLRCDRRPHRGIATR